MTAADLQEMESALAFSRGVAPKKQPVSSGGQFPGLPSKENIFKQEQEEQQGTTKGEDSGGSTSFEDEWYEDRAEWVAYREISKVCLCTLQASVTGFVVAATTR
jgi:hypothetical protein